MGLTKQEVVDALTQHMNNPSAPRLERKEATQLLLWATRCSPDAQDFRELDDSFRVSAETIFWAVSALRQQQQAAAQPPQAPAGAGAAGSSGMAAGLVTAEQLKQVVIEAMQQMNKQPTQETKAFSKVGSTEATQLLQQLNLVEVDGNSLDPVHVPADTAVCSSFDYSQYGDENAGTPALLKHHQAQLQKLGVKFGRGGYAMYDLHNQSALYTIATSTTTYQGNTDVCVAPFGLMVASAAIQCRVAYEHKQSPEQKQAFRDKHPTEELGQVSGKGPVRFAAAWKGQAIAATIGAYAHNNYPLMFDLTDGVVHHVLQVRGMELFEWTNLSPQQAYYLQAKMLNENLQLLSIRSLTLEAIPEQLQPSMKRMRFLRPSSALQEQLESIVPDLASNEEKLQGTLELMAEWARRDQLAMPVAVQAMFG